MKLCRGPAGDRPWRSGARRDHPQMPAPTDRVGLVVVIVPLGDGTGGFADRLGERDEIVVGRWGRTELAVVPHQVPATRSGQAPGMRLAEVVGVWLGKRRQRADDG